MEGELKTKRGINFNGTHYCIVKRLLLTKLGINVYRFCFVFGGRFPRTFKAIMQEVTADFKIN